MNFVIACLVGVLVYLLVANWDTILGVFGVVGENKGALVSQPTGAVKRAGGAAAGDVPKDVARAGEQATSPWVYVFWSVIAVFAGYGGFLYVTQIGRVIEQRRRPGLQEVGPEVAAVGAEAEEVAEEVAVDRDTVDRFFRAFADNLYEASDPKNNGGEEGRRLAVSALEELYGSVAARGGHEGLKKMIRERLVSIGMPGRIIDTEKGVKKWEEFLRRNIMDTEDMDPSEIDALSSGLSLEYMRNLERRVQRALPGMARVNFSWASDMSKL